MVLESWFKRLISAARLHSIWQDAAAPGSNDVPVPMSRTLLHTVLHGLVLLVFLMVLKRMWTKAGSKPSNTLFKPDTTTGEADNKNQWTPQRFDYPEVTPCAFELKNLKPVPYRPFRWGQYHVTMGIRAMPWSEWIELDSTYSIYQRVRSFRLRTRERNVVRVLPLREDGIVQVLGGAEAAKELAYELAEYLSRRYPTSFRVTRISPSSSSIPSIGGVPLSWDGKLPIRVIEVNETGAKFDLSILGTLEGVAMGEQAMKIVTGLVQEDIAIMIEGSDGKYYFQAGSICTPGFWRMDDKIGMPLDEIHMSGNVPQFKEKLEMSMERFFRRMPLDKPVIRNNYFIQVVKPSETVESARERPGEMISDVDSEELGWSRSTNGPEDDFVHGHGHGAEPAEYLEPATLRLRSERQTLRRLPRTGAVIFGIRTYLFKVEELARERGVAGRLASAIRSWPDDVAIYKGRKMYRDILLSYLDECAEVIGPEASSMATYPY
ncbi:hypothetical protein J3R82DRAFT_3950 [Butyriboletus roseoflavus]|nr:hypothetical protein J3R82DRAFT_3950 [Butyriboletus roseoflavus]